MNDLATFLRTRLDEDEAAARAASPGPWHVNAEADEVLAVDGITVCDGFALSGRQLRATTEYIARHDPARVLAEVDAKRRILDIHQVTSYDNSESGADEGYGCRECGWSAEYSDQGGWCETLRLLALPHVDHPDYQDTWRS
ncbi:DUF6221 family protein [Streptomyces sp. 796.1]|uniref:DUF6221 family protein n=1 Tax=Streptomyces sp. 796.1 TaxID=3163029 RepID=UPI0039C9C29D